MPELRQIVQKVRSKNAGPFWLTIDIFCGEKQAYDTVVRGLSTERLAQVLKLPTDLIKRFDIADLCVVKFSFPRPQVQGSIQDRDMHGASWAALVSEIELN
jgi:hypothetical protein